MATLTTSSSLVLAMSTTLLMVAWQLDHFGVIAPVSVRIKQTDKAQSVINM